MRLGISYCGSFHRSGTYRWSTQVLFSSSWSFCKEMSRPMTIYPGLSMWGILRNLLHQVRIAYFSILKHSINDQPRRLAFIFAAISMVDKPCNRPSASTTISTSNGFDGRSPVMVNGPSVSVSSLSSGRTSRDGSDKVLAGLRGVGLEFGFVHRGYSRSICWWMRARMSLNGIWPA